MTALGATGKNKIKVLRLDCHAVVIEEIKVCIVMPLIATYSLLLRFGIP